jgi:hypothetical protein
MFQQWNFFYNYTYSSSYAMLNSVACAIEHILQYWMNFERAKNGTLFFSLSLKLKKLLNFIFLLNFISTT